MDVTNIIEDYFSGLDAKSPVPIYKQLEERAGRCIDSLPDNTLFPSDRELAAFLKLNRRTVTKALSPLIDSKRLNRTARGTFVHKRKSFSLADIHPLNFAMNAPIFSKKTMKLLLYENMPHQVEFWEKTVSEFNDSSENCTVKLEWMPSLSPFSYEKAIHYLADSDSDLMQLPVTRIWNEKTASMFAPPPAGIRSLFDDPAYRIADTCSTYPEMLSCSVPFAAGFRILTCNMNLFRSLGFSKFPSDLRDFARLKFPEGTFMTEHISSLFETFGFTLRCTREQAGNFLKELIRLFLGHLCEKERLSICSPESPGTFSYEKYLNGNILLVPNGSGGMLRYLLDHSEIEQKNFLPKPVKGHFTQMNCNLFGMNRKTLRTEEIEKFLNFMLSENIQREVAADGSIPMLKKADPVLAELLKVPLSEFEKYVSYGKELPFFFDPRYEVTERFFHELAAGNLDGLREDAIVEKILSATFDAGKEVRP